MFLPRTQGTIAAEFRGYEPTLLFLVCWLTISYLVSFVSSLLALLKLRKMSKGPGTELACTKAKKQGVKALVTIKILNGIFIISSILGVVAYRYYSLLEK